MPNKGLLSWLSMENALRMEQIWSFTLYKSHQLIDIENRMFQSSDFYTRCSSAVHRTCECIHKPNRNRLHDSIRQSSSSILRTIYIHSHIYINLCMNKSFTVNLRRPLISFPNTDHLISSFSSSISKTVTWQIARFNLPHFFFVSWSSSPFSVCLCLSSNIQFDPLSQK